MPKTTKEEVPWSALGKQDEPVQKVLFAFRTGLACDPEERLGKRHGLV